MWRCDEKSLKCRSSRVTNSVEAFYSIPYKIIITKQDMKTDLKYKLQMIEDDSCPFICTISVKDSYKMIYHIR